jgi:hypothetical protein
LFAPVAAQLRTRLARLSALPATTASPERLRSVARHGQPDVAARLARRATGDSSAALVAAARVAMAVRDYKVAAPLVERLAALSDNDCALDALRVGVPPRQLGADRHGGAPPHPRGDAGAVPELLAAGRLAFDQQKSSARTRSTCARWRQSPPASRSPRAARGRRRTSGTRRPAEASRLGRLARHAQGSLGAVCDARSLMTLTETLIRLGRTDEAISAGRVGGAARSLQ